MRAIALLSWWQIRNALRSNLTNPKKLLPMLFFGIMIGMQVLTFAAGAFTGTPRQGGASRLLLQYLDQADTLVFFMLILLAVGILDSAFNGKFLAFSLADVDILFTSPVPRRVVLAYRLAAKTGTAFLQALLFFYFAIWRTMHSVAPEGMTAAASVAALAGLFFCMAGYTNLALALKLIFGFGRLPTMRRWLLGLLVAFVGTVGFIFWRQGWEGLTNVGKSWLPVALFYPCRLATDALLAPLHGGSGALAAGLLLLFYLLTLALVFSRNENFYEASLEGTERSARLIQAAKEQNWAQMFALQSEGRRKKTSGPERPYTVRPFGRGAWALLWAHVAAAGKRPVPNLWLPLLGSAGVTLAVTVFARDVAALIAGGGAAYLLFTMTMQGITVFQQSLRRQSLIRPMPFPHWQVVAMDVVPRVFISSLIGWGAGLTLLVMGPPHADRVGVLLVLCLPLALTWLSLFQYILALWFPDTQDKLQQGLAGFIGFAFTGVSIGLMAALLAVPLMLQAPAWVTVLVFALPAAGAICLMLFLAGLVYRRFEPK